MLTKNLATNYCGIPILVRDHTNTYEGAVIETESELIVAAKWWLLS